MRKHFINHDYKELDVWKESIKFVKKIYKITYKFPGTEKFNLISQINRASVSIASNIAEGSSRNSDKEFVQFLYYALGSAAEVECQLIISQELDFLKVNEFFIFKEIDNIKKMIIGLIKYYKN